MANILILDDQAPTRLALRRALTSQGHQCWGVKSVPEARARAPEVDAEVLVADLAIVDRAGGPLDEICPPVPASRVILTSEQVSTETTQQALERGALDCIAKPVDFAALAQLIQRCLEGAPVLDIALAAADEPPEPGRLLFRSAAMREVVHQISQLAPHSITVLIHGESGTGKELVARALHDLSDRSHEPFVAIHCGAIPEELLESELFGHEKGSFTDAHQTKPGRFETAGAGTLFLDEIGEMSPKLQAKLLRALQEKEIQRIGSNKLIQLRARIVTATHRDLRQEVARGDFREDLLHRLMVATLELPALRDRPDDVDFLAAAFLRRFADEYGRPVLGLDRSAMDALHAYPWPGNVRELEHVIQRATVLSRATVLTAEDLPDLETSPRWIETWEDSLRDFIRRHMRDGAKIERLREQLPARVLEILRETTGDSRENDRDSG